jgi:hypothetical protein
MTRIPLLAAAVCGFVGASAAVVQAAPVTGTRFAISLGNQVEPPTTHLAQDESITHATSVDAQYSRDFTGITSVFCEDECFEELGTMTLSAHGRANAANGVLKASVSATVDNPVLLSGDGYENDPFVIDTDFNTDQNGIPDVLRAQSLATFNDTVAVAGANGLSSIQLEFQLTGEIARNGTFAAFAQVGQDTNGPFTAGPGTSLGIAGGVGAFDMTVLSDPIDVVGGFADLSFGLYTVVRYDISDLGDGGGSYTTTVDFFSTLAIQNIIGLNENGEQIALSNVTGSDGTIFFDQPTGDVPEPMTAVLLSIGLVTLGAARRRRA